MSAKSIFILCTLALLVQSALSQCHHQHHHIGAPCELSRPAWAYDGLRGSFACDGWSDWNGRGFAHDGLYPAIAPAIDFIPTSGGGLPVTSVSAAPVGISVASETCYEGALAVVGELPFVGTVGFDKMLPTTGAGAVNHACGNGLNIMVSENAAFAPGIAPFGAIAPGVVAPHGYRAGWPGVGCGCGL